MKAVILAGGAGTRIAEETSVKPKPMVEIGGKPILWHIMKIFAAQGVTEFIVCLGYRGYVIKEYFLNYRLHLSDVTFHLATGDAEIHQTAAEPWKVTLIDTGETTMTGGRLKRVLPLVGDEDFFLTYGDGVSDVDLSAVVAMHDSSDALVTVTAVQPAGRFGALEMEGDRVHGFQEKPVGDGGWINGGFFVVSPEVDRYIDGDESIWEREPLEGIAADGRLTAYKHTGFWHAMDTLRDRLHLEELWDEGAPPWRVWG